MLSQSETSVSTACRIVELTLFEREVNQLYPKGPVGFRRQIVRPFSQSNQMRREIQNGGRPAFQEFADDLLHATDNGDSSRLRAVSFAVVPIYLAASRWPAEGTWDTNENRHTGFCR